MMNFMIYTYCDMMPETCNLPSAGRGFTEHTPVATRKAPRVDGELLERISAVTNTTEEAMHCMQSHVDS
jgi:hypothetical protein